MVLEQTLVPPLVQDIALVLALAAVVVLVFHRLRLSLVVGYLFVGILVGPVAPAFGVVRNAEAIATIAELGVILLIFTIGLEFNLRKLRRLGLRILLIGTVEVLLMVTIGYWVGVLLGWTFLEAVYLGAILAIASTTVIVKSLIESRKMSSEQGQLAVGILIIEDLAVVVFLTLLSGLSTAGAVAPLTVLAIVGRMALFAFVSTALGLLAVPRLVDYVARLNLRELLLMTVLGLCFGMALFATVLGLTPAVGAFVMGVLVAEADRNRDVLRAIGPLRDVFVALFFVAMGLLVDLGSLRAHLLLGLLIAGVFVAAKATVLSVTSALFGTEGKTAIALGVTMVAMGEFSLLIAKLGQQDLGVTRDFLFPVTVTVILVTAVMAPFTIRASDRLGAAVFRRLPLRIREYGLLLSRWTAWTSRSLRQETPATEAIREDLRTFLVDVAILAVAGAFAWMVFLFQTELAALGGLSPGVLVLAAGLAFVVASLHPLLRILRVLRHLMRVATGAMVEASPSARLVGFRTLHKVLLLVLAGVVLLVSGLTASVLLSGLAALSPLVLLVLTGSAVAAVVLLWESLRILHRRLEVAFTRRIRAAPPEEEGGLDESGGHP